MNCQPSTSRLAGVVLLVVFCFLAPWLAAGTAYARMLPPDHARDPKTQPNKPDLAPALADCAWQLEGLHPVVRPGWTPLLKK
jgi:hypothetical protein